VPVVVAAQVEHCLAFDARLGPSRPLLGFERGPALGRARTLRRVARREHREAVIAFFVRLLFAVARIERLAALGRTGPSREAVALLRVEGPEANRTYPRLPPLIALAFQPGVAAGAIVRRLAALRLPFVLTDDAAVVADQALGDVAAHAWLAGEEPRRG